MVVSLVDGGQYDLLSNRIRQASARWSFHCLFAWWLRLYANLSLASICPGCTRDVISCWGRVEDQLLGLDGLDKIGEAEQGEPDLAPLTTENWLDNVEHFGPLGNESLAALT
ncbi:hypothetical protein Dimus_018665 [Dionaea muscipula]